jgi:hypothetical protein
MLRRAPTTITLTTEDIAIYVDRREAQAREAEKKAREQEEQSLRMAGPGSGVMSGQGRERGERSRADRLGLGSGR